MNQCKKRRKDREREGWVNGSERQWGAKESKSTGKDKNVWKDKNRDRKFRRRWEEKEEPKERECFLEEFIYLPRVDVLGSIAEFVTIACRVSLTFPSALKCVGVARTRLTLQTSMSPIEFPWPSGVWQHSRHTSDAKTPAAKRGRSFEAHRKEMTRRNCAGKSATKGVFASGGRHPRMRTDNANVLSIWQIAVICQHAVDQWFSTTCL